MSHICFSCVCSIIMARLLLALREDDEEAIVRVHHEMGFRSQKQTPHVSKQLAVIAFDRDDRKTCEGMNLQVCMCICSRSSSHMQ